MEKKVAKSDKKEFVAEPKTGKVDKSVNPDIQKLANRIRTLRKSLGYTNADFFAYENEITRSQYARYEKGEDIRFSSLMKIIKAFKMTPEEFFREGFD